MLCVFIHGPAACGKLTVANALQKTSGFRLFHNHHAVDAALALFDFGSPGFVRLRSDIWLSAFREAATTGQSFIFTFHPEASVPPEFIPAGIAAIELHGGRTLFVALTCGEQTIESRIVASSRRAFQKLTSLDLYRTLRDSGAFSFSSLPVPAITLATDELSPEQAAARIQSVIDGTNLEVSRT